MEQITLNAIIIDDEQDSVDAIETILNEYCSNINVVAKTTSPSEGIKQILSKKPQLVFLDIEMPHINGFQVLESIPDRKFEIIFITAYNHYAIQAFKVSAVDYILKPLNIAELVNAVNKVIHKYQKKIMIDDNYENLFKNLKSLKKKKLTFSTIDGTEIVNAEEIIRVVADGSYSTIYFTDRKPMLISKNLKEIEEMLDPSVFFRTHKSYIINIAHIKKYNLQAGSEIELIDGTKVVISRRKKDDFVQKVEEFLA